MKFTRYHKIIYILLSLAVMVAITSFSVYNSIKVTDNYLTSVFSKVEHELNILAEDNLQKAKTIYRAFEEPEIIHLDDTSLNSFYIHYYPDRNQYGFNQGIYPDVVAAGTLYGYGEIPDYLKSYRGDFLALDKIWGGYKRSLIPNLPGLVNYRHNYIYIGSIYKLKEISNNVDIDDVDLYDTAISPRVYRQGLGLNYTKSMENNGYFISAPFKTFHSGSWRVALLVPIIRENELVADLGVSFEVRDIIKLIDLYPTLKDSISINFDYRLAGQGMELNTPKYKNNPVYSFKHDLPSYIELKANYDVMYFVKGNIELVVLMILFFSIIYIHLIGIDARQKSRKELLEQLNIDPMTQLYNRHAMDNLISNRIAKEKEMNSICFVAIDGDKFKELNDTHGHSVGDKALKHIASVMKEFVRSNDYCIRMGGDEFMIVFFGVKYDDALAISERIEQRISTSSYDAIGTEFSATCAPIELGINEGFDQAYKRVDDALYQRKKSTR